MSKLQIFNNDEFGQVRTMEIDGVLMFVASDIANALGYSNPRKAILDHCKGVTKRDTLTAGGVQTVSYIPEGDMYRLIMRSKLPSAERFESWVVNEVIPSIRKHGGYIAGQETMSDEELMAKALLVAQNKIAERDAIIQRQQELIEDAKPKTVFADAVATSKSSILVGEMAKLICQNGYSIGQKRLFQWLRDNGYLMKYGNSWNMPTQRSIEQGLFEIKESAIQNPDGTVRVTRTPKITGAGQIYFINKFLGGEA